MLLLFNLEGFLFLIISSVLLTSIMFNLFSISETFFCILSFKSVKFIFGKKLKIEGESNPLLSSL